MRIIKFIQAFMIASAVLTSCSKDPDDGNEKNETPDAIEKGEFAKGADISWVTQMEKDGVKFYGADGNSIECTALMKEIGMNAIRLRVWVDPEDGWCGKDDVLIKARRAQALGMRLMIDFHYSDSWADPSKQVRPAAWTDFRAEKLAEAVAGHTEEVLRMLKDNGVDVEWVQVGNEINSGMLHPHGDITNGGNVPDFVSFVNAGHDAVKSIYPEAKVILHRSNGQDTDGFDWFLKLLQFQKVRYDIIGMSLYPVWWENNGWTQWKPVVDRCLANIRSFTATYGKPVMICETGMPVSELQMAEEALEYILSETGKIEDCHGVFYWEPQTDGKWKPESYHDLGWSAYDKGAFADGRPTTALDPFRK